MQRLYTEQPILYSSLKTKLIISTPSQPVGLIKEFDTRHFTTKTLVNIDSVNNSAERYLKGIHEFWRCILLFDNPSKAETSGF